MKYAVQLKLPPIPIYSAGVDKLLRHIGMPIEQGAPNLGVYEITQQQTREVKAILPPEMQAALMGVTIIRVNQAYPHVHVDAGLTAINWYLETGGEATSFYEGPIVDIAAQNFVDVGNGYAMPDPTLLTCVQRYVAKDGDIWMIDLMAPHSVSTTPDHPDFKVRYAPTGGKPREALHVTFNMPFARAVQFMKRYARV